MVGRKRSHLQRKSNGPRQSVEKETSEEQKDKPSLITIVTIYKGITVDQFLQWHKSKNPGTPPYQCEDVVEIMELKLTQEQKRTQPPPPPPARKEKFRNRLKAWLKSFFMECSRMVWEDRWTVAILVCVGWIVCRMLDEYLTTITKQKKL